MLESCSYGVCLLGDKGKDIWGLGGERGTRKEVHFGPNFR